MAPFLAISWLGPLISDMPPSASPPRWMTAPHPEAVGSYGAAATEWAQRELKITLRWFQRLELTRLLEHRADGTLCWRYAIVSTPRRAGKSIALRVLACWRVAHAALLGESQTVLFTGKDLPICKEIHSAAWTWAVSAGWRVLRGMGNEAIIVPDGSRWLVRSQNGVYGYPAGLAMCDESWAVPDAVIREGLQPALMDRTNPQMLLTSTAHTKATTLMLRRIKDGLDQLDGSGNTLLLLWSADPDAEADDRAQWRAAAPHWDAAREQLVEDAWNQVLTGQAVPDPMEPDPVAAFRAQYMNIWPSSVVNALPGVALVEEAVWDALRLPGLHIPAEGIVGALEASVGHPPGIAAAWRDPDGRICVVGRILPTLEAGWGALGGMPPGTTFLVGLSWRSHQKAQDLGATGVGSRETEQALPILQDLVKAGSLAWDGDALGEQMRALRVVDSPSAAGKAVVRSNTPTHVARAAAWAIWRLDQAATPAPVIW